MTSFEHSLKAVQKLNKKMQAEIDEVNNNRELYIKIISKAFEIKYPADLEFKMGDTWEKCNHKKLNWNKYDYRYTANNGSWIATQSHLFIEEIKIKIFDEARETLDKMIDNMK